jgi:type IV secretory pathway VirB9-like protein
MKTIFLFLFVFFATCLAASAQTQKVTLQRFGESDLHVIRTQKGFSTIVEFPVNQGILEATCGDKEFWVIEGSGRFLNLKPAKEGITTNLNVLVEGDIIYSFLLKEVSKSKGAKEEADFRVTVTSIDELVKLRKDRDDLDEAIAARERDLKELTRKYEAELSRAAKKEPDSTGNKTGKSGAPAAPQGTTPAGATTGYRRPPQMPEMPGVWRQFGSSDLPTGALTGPPKQ